ncbi:non-ribosomal peptide synthetase [Burkholderia pseudomallei]|nr:non-ribosomal peptide synthetase [Burkholderia pseudomallei]
MRRARAMALDAHATLPMLLHAALNAAFYRATGATDQPVGVLASTRELTGDARSAMSSPRCARRARSTAIRCSR